MTISLKYLELSQGREWATIELMPVGFAINNAKCNLACGPCACGVNHNREYWVWRAKTTDSIYMKEIFIKLISVVDENSVWRGEILMPENFVFMNNNIRCNVVNGFCACGMPHNKDYWFQMDSIPSRELIDYVEAFDEIPKIDNNKKRKSSKIIDPTFADLIIAINDDLVPLYSSKGDFSNTFLRILNTPFDGFIEVYVNNIKCNVGDGVRTQDCYFSGDDGRTARLLNDIITGDVLFWNCNIVGFDLNNTDRVNFIYYIMKRNKIVKTKKRTTNNTKIGQIGNRKINL